MSVASHLLLSENRKIEVFRGLDNAIDEFYETLFHLAVDYNKVELAYAKTVLDDSYPDGVPIKSVLHNSYAAWHEDEEEED